MWEREGGGHAASSEAAAGQTLHPAESMLFWTRELFYLGLIREERTVAWHSGGVGHVLSYVPPYLILPAPTLHAAVVLLGGWQGVGRKS